MQFGILGPLRVSGADGEITISGPRLRAVLALLLLRAGRTVTSDQLAEAVWDARASPNSRTALPSYVMRLRRTLGPEAGGRVVTRNGGYAIELDEGELDLFAFQDLCGRAQALVDSDDPNAAQRVLAEALGLWRGEPLADVPDSAVLRREVEAMRSARLRAQHQHVDLQLRLGQHTALLSELPALAEAHPFDERLTARLMLALHRSGRRVEALEVYQASRRVLVGQLGIEPGAELRELHGAMLADDPSLLPAPGRGGDVLAPPPAAAPGVERPARSPAGMVEDPGHVPPPAPPEERRTDRPGPSKATPDTLAAPHKPRPRRRARPFLWVGGVLAVLLATTAVSDQRLTARSGPVGGQGGGSPVPSRARYVTRLAEEVSPKAPIRFKGMELQINDPVPDGDTLIATVLLGDADTGPISVTDTVGNNYRSVGTPMSDGKERLAVFIAVHVKALDTLDTIHIHWPDAALGFAVVDEFRGVGAAGPWTDTLGSDGVPLQLGGTMPCEEGDLLYAAIGSTGGPTPTLPGEWHTLPTVGRDGPRMLGAADPRLTIAYSTWNGHHRSTNCEGQGIGSRRWYATLVRLR
ncbi:BTAD domain-containing putative transcriptional regulator [Kitasatospora sp. NPDC059722]|uniref:AfsR/SARP family transcriptional regulator n=1 Tax=Kitasatospora sp. NPDC059722 TaxID=3346925 RepID=UPI0036C47C82